MELDLSSGNILFFNQIPFLDIIYICNFANPFLVLELPKKSAKSQTHSDNIRILENVDRSGGWHAPEEEEEV